MGNEKEVPMGEAMKYLGRTRPNGVQYCGREGKVFWSLFPQCAGAAHMRCEIMIVKIGTAESPRKMLGWNHCACKCHIFKKTKTGWRVDRAMVKVPNV